jgi:hypothetical protein
LVIRSVPSTFVSHIQRQWSSSASITGASPRAPPALFTSTRASPAASANAATDEGDVTSSGNATPPISSATC